jgi:hypothetical protein
MNRSSAGQWVQPPRNLRDVRFWPLADIAGCAAHVCFPGQSERGAEHANVDNRQIGIDFVADWIEDTL